jgi:hypothetical protein
MMRSHRHKNQDRPKLYSSRFTPCEQRQRGGQPKHGADWPLELAQRVAPVVRCAACSGLKRASKKGINNVDKSEIF